jgi:hypothetical protein
MLILLAFVAGILYLYLTLVPRAVKPSVGALELAASGVDRISVNSAPGYPHQAVDITGTKDIKELFRAIEIDGKRSDTACACKGQTWLTIFVQGKDVATLSIHHGKHLRWVGGPWTDDAFLTPKSANAIDQWLKNRGYEPPRN